MSSATPEDAQEEGGMIVFADIVFNVFAIVVIFLLVVPVVVLSSDAPAPTRSRAEPDFLTVRACHVEALRPASLFVLYRDDGLSIVDHDAVALAFARAEGARAMTEAGHAEITMPDGAADANVFALDYTLFTPSPVAKAGAGSRLDADLAFLHERVYGRDYTPYFEVEPHLLAEFSALFAQLLDRGERFRWRLMRGGAMTRYRGARAFETADFCR